jgi:hypothetical protein
MNASNTKLNASLCAASAFLPLLITAWYIFADIELTEWRILFNPINLTAFLWLGLTVLHYRHNLSQNQNLGRYRPAVGQSGHSADIHAAVSPAGSDPRTRVSS